ncbi:MAG TPA: ribosome maturation factor RimM [Ignavibacteriaceae bacterium]|nr:ribosome maturation factor RimM [Ignavibacteriaceae bacterium]
MNEYILIAEITSAGKDGYVKILAKAGFDKLFNKISEVYLDFWNQKKLFEIEDVSAGKISLYVKFKRFEDQRDISLLIGRNIFLLSEQLEELNREAELLPDIVGYKVYQKGLLSGSVVDVFQAPANDVIVFIDNNGKEILLPYVLSIFEKIDLENKILILNPEYGVGIDED